SQVSPCVPRESAAPGGCGPAAATAEIQESCELFPDQSGCACTEWGLPDGPGGRRDRRFGRPGRREGGHLPLGEPGPGESQLSQGPQTKKRLPADPARWDHGTFALEPKCIAITFGGQRDKMGWVMGTCALAGVLMVNSYPSPDLP
ncbi:unnamed protein product, partial [Gulo gulo]